MELSQTAGECAGSCRSCATVGSCPDRVVCRCLGVTEQAIVTAIVALGLRTVKEVRQATEAGDGCTCCHRELNAYLAVYSPSSSPAICSAK
ncbi:: Fer2_BFD [Gemmata massiliana]|uniref:: Fer2_BFD n=1 Tax=Gemmata massiliana TaxID=1210884 RepID=A0A6P2D521_9BACT|nr:(2Fe-2S)-binding protein [Gemmata massiliana]VTR94520.1 : Fer2_BFD [Gemmata massiliana]